MYRHVLAPLGPSVLGAVALVVALEVALRLAGWSHAVPLGGDPFVNLIPLFHRVTEAGGVVMRRTDGSEFPLEKPANGFRVFVLGESSVLGVPYPPEYSFPGFLRQRLTAMLPQRRVEVI